MRDGSRCKSYKTPQGGHSVTRSPALVQDSTQSLTEAPAPTITQSQIDVTTYVPVLQTESLQQTSAHSEAQSSTTNFNKSHTNIQSHPQPLIPTECCVFTKGDGPSCPQSQVLVQVVPRTLTQEVVYSHPQVLLQTHVNTQSELHTPSQVQSHVHSQAHTNCQVLTQVQVHTEPQENTQIPSLSPVCTHLQADNQPPLPSPPPPPPPPSQAQAHIQRYAHSQSLARTQLPTPHLLTQSQIHSQPQTHSQTTIHIQPRVHTHTQVHVRNHAQIEPCQHSDSQPQAHSAPSMDTHIHVQSQLQPLSLQAQLPTLSQASLSSTLPELVVTTQVSMKHIYYS